MVAMLHVLFYIKHQQDKCGKGALHEACEEGHLHVVELLVDHGANLDICQQGLSTTPLHHPLRSTLVHPLRTTPLHHPPLPTQSIVSRPCARLLPVL